MTTPLPLRLECDGLDTLDLTTWPLAGRELDLGHPIVREVVDNAPDANGTIDVTTYFGARVVTLALTLDSDRDDEGRTRWALTSRLKAFTRPDLRPRLYLQFHPDDPELMVTLRGSQFSDPWTPHNRRTALVAVQWVCPSGIIESAELHSVDAGAGGFDEQPGRAYDLDFDRDYPSPDPSSGGALATNDGNVPVWPILTMFGPASNGIVLRNDTTGKQMEFASSLSIAAGDWIEVNTATKRITNSAGNNYYDTLDFPASTWWQLQPGDNRVFMIPDTYTPPASVRVEWHDGWT